MMTIAGKRKRFGLIPSGYKFDRYIFRSVIIILCIIGFSILAANKFESKYYYIYCEDFGRNVYCENPYFQSDVKFIPQEIKDMRMLPPNFEYGNKPPVIYNYIWLITYGLIVGGFVLNHYKHNRGRLKLKDFK